MKKNKGITLVALIITIIILLILAVVTISAIKGDGIIKKAKEAQRKMEQAAEEEQKGLNELNDLIDNNINNSGKNEGNEFIIGTQKYNMEKNMTWKEWVESSYNVDKYKIDGNTTNGTILREDSIDTIKYCVTTDRKVLAKDNIVSGQTYTITTVKLPIYWYLSKEGEYISVTEEESAHSILKTALSNEAQLVHCLKATCESESRYNEEHEMGICMGISEIEGSLTTNEKLIVTRQINKNVYKHGYEIEKINDTSQITTIQELLQQMNVDTSEKITTNKGNKIDINQYELITSMEEIYLTNDQNDRNYNINESINLKISNEAIGSLEQENLLLICIGANTEKDEIYLIEPNEYDSVSGSVTIELSNLGSIAILYNTYDDGE